MDHQLGFLNQHHLNAKVPLILGPAEVKPSNMSRYTSELCCSVFFSWVSGLKEEQVSGLEEEVVKKLLNRA